VFREAAPLAAAVGLFTHVYVDRESRRPTAVPDAARRAVAGLLA
jgi:acyl-CoA thioester hydrolase